MLTDAQRSKILGQLQDVYKSRVQLPLLTKTWPEITVEDSYAIQQAFIASLVEQGQRLSGYKVGLTSKAMQQMAGSTEPDFSGLTNAMFLAESSEINAAEYFDPLVEIEIAFVTGSRLQGPGLNAADIIRATDFVLPAIELVDFRVRREQGLTVVDTVADLAACGAVILGGNPVKLTDLDLRRVSGSLHVNGEVTESGLASAVLGNPVTSVAWLANKLATFDVVFEPGQVILSGSFIRAVPVKAGDHVEARFGEHLGNVALSFR